jgi:hypothetical protein
MHIFLAHLNHQLREHAGSEYASALHTIPVAIHMGFPEVRDLKTTCASAYLLFPFRPEHPQSPTSWYELGLEEGRFDRPLRSGVYSGSPEKGHQRRIDNMR